MSAFESASSSFGTTSEPNGKPSDSISLNFEFVIRPADIQTRFEVLSCHASCMLSIPVVCVLTYCSSTFSMSVSSVVVIVFAINCVSVLSMYCDVCIMRAGLCFAPLLDAPQPLS